MALVFKRIMIVTDKVQFTVDIKLALESLGDYEVTNFSSVQNAIERLQKQAHNLVLLDVESLSIPAPDVINMILKTQKEIAIVLAPDVPDVRDLAVQWDIQGIVNIPVPVRTLLPIIESSVQEIFDNLPDTIQAPAINMAQETVYIEALVDELLGEDETPYFTSRQIRAQKQMPTMNDDLEGTTRDHQNSLEILIESSSQGETVRMLNKNDDDIDERSLLLFQKLAEEEPPMPGFQENGTISDLAKSVSQSKPISLFNVEDDDDDETDDGSNSMPAILVLQTAIDETTPVQAISLQTLYANIKEQLPPDKQSIRPLPSWVKEGEKFVREPTFLQEELVLIDPDTPIEYTSTTTQPSDGSLVVSNSGDLETEVIEGNQPLSIDDFVSDLKDDEDGQQDVEDFHDDEKVDEIVEDGASSDVIEEVPSDRVNIEPVEKDVQDETSQPPVVLVKDQAHDAYLTQLAVTLTQVTTELTAEATILTRNNVIVAYSGEMPMEDIDDLRTDINDDWTTGLDNARIRFITLQSSGKDYMLYSKGTVGGFTLSMVFAGTRQLRTIRRQGERLINALQSTPEPITYQSPVQEVENVPEPASVESPIQETEDVPESKPQETLTTKEVMGFDGDNQIEHVAEDDDPIDVGPKLPYTFIWLVDDLQVQISVEVAKKLIFWLEVQLNGLHWTVFKLDVHQDFIYLHADVPGDTQPSALVRDLMERSLKIAMSEDDSLPEDLWADAYLVLTPGRDLTDREIQRFLNFARDEG